MMSSESEQTPKVDQRSPVAVPGPTGRRPWSTLLLREWAALKYSGLLLREQLRLGPTTATLAGVQVDPALEAMLRVSNWYADGVIITSAEVLIIEAKVKADPSAISQVLFYRVMAIRTPALAEMLHKPIVPIVLYGESDNDVNQFARQMGCRVEIYTPGWIADYLTQVQFRRRSTAPAVA
jgi:hypothetical protein